MLSRVLAVALCLSVTNRCSVKKDEQINLIFGPALFYGNSGIYKNKSTLPWNFFLNSGP